ncbi:MAG: glycosyltransferase [Candidatus Binatia bacterium]|nr:glycosyltransferase [Candidatus Binatia bacterium]
MLISVVIPCYNQARFLAEAIESVLAQTYPRFEIIVVDDGSTDHTAAVARSYSQVTYLHQANQGLSAARNAGWRACAGECVVFLDADDRLLPGALAAGIGCVQDHPECAFVSGHFRYITADGTFLHEYPQIYVARDHYQAFLRGNYIGMHATVMYRRSALEEAGGFDPSLRACEDYDLYLRIARVRPVCCHKTVVAEYRQHDHNMSGDALLMFRTVRRVLRTQWAFAAPEPALRSAWKSGMRTWTRFYGKRVLKQFLRSCLDGDRRQTVQAFLALLQGAVTLVQPTVGTHRKLAQVVEEKK